ncbi:hypothetical protein PINS_up008110 [Pythium insidiosum]|nr:hypothetical protein PINS_up008110 [Pythium insidiosum]
MQVANQRASAERSQVLQARRWVRDHCVDTILESPLLLSPSWRHRFAAEKLQALLLRFAVRSQARRFHVWTRAVSASRCQELTLQYCRLKAAHLLMARARRHLSERLRSLWAKWCRLQREERDHELFAAVVTLQSWMRCQLMRRRLATMHLERAATEIAAAWRGFFCRKLQRRRRRFHAYVTAAEIVQRAFRTYVNRVQFAIHWGRHKASIRITRNLRRYCWRRRMFRSWCHRVARFHSAAVIQIWMRRRLRHIRFKRAYHHSRSLAAVALQRFFRFVYFVRVFGARVQRLVERRQRAATRLQQAYRAKMARARFHALKDQLEEQLRRETLQRMWDNAYATSIQRWWRQQQQRQRRRHLRRQDDFPSQAESSWSVTMATSEP